jgi:hypothetical protein
MCCECEDALFVPTPYRCNAREVKTLRAQAQKSFDYFRREKWPQPAFYQQNGSCGRMTAVPNTPHY